jgi:hypothetical protein
MTLQKHGDLPFDLRAGSTSFVSPAAFDRWAAMAHHGERATYALGFIARDGGPPLGGAVLLRETARVARRSSDQELVFLVQKKVNEGCYEYIAIRNGAIR